jgi:hypothetical protein
MGLDMRVRARHNGDARASYPASHMAALDEFRDRVDQIERSPRDPDACRRLVQEICAYPWETVGERNAAQVLVNRLDRLCRARFP